MWTTPINLSLLFFLFAGCQARVVDRRAQNISPKQGVEQNIPVLAGSTPIEPADKWKLFNKDHNFLRTSSSDFNYTKTQFKVFDQVDGAIVPFHEIMAHRYRMLDRATRSVRIQSLLFWSDPPTWQIADKLIELKNRGLDVRVILDAPSNLDVESQRLQFYLAQKGVRIEGYDPFYLFPLGQGFANKSLIDGLLAFNMRFHEKIFVIDAEDPNLVEATMGGANWSSQYFRTRLNDPINNWRDQDIAFKGQAAIDLARMFDENYQYFVNFRKKESFVDFEGFWDFLQAGKTLLNKDEIIRVNRPAKNVEEEALIAQKLATPPTIQYGKLNKLRFFQNHPRNSRLYIQDVYLSMIQSATQSIDIVNPYLLPDESLTKALHNAVKRGVRVRILTNSRHTAEFDIVAQASYASFKDLLSVNSQIQLPVQKQLELYVWLGDKIRKNGEGHHHAKYAVFDREAYIVGSFNLDPRSRTQNSENIALVLDKPTAEQLCVHFEEEIGPSYSDLIKYDDVKTEAPPEGFKDAINRGLIPFVRPYL